jgi:hypothetical protein
MKKLEVKGKGRFIPKNPDKYIGDPNKITFRSSWELTCMKRADSREDVLRWNSEEFSIPYFLPSDGKVHQYYPDMFIEWVDEDGIIHKEIIEIKPRHEAVKQYAKSDRSKDALEINEAKWVAAMHWCKENGFEFRVLTEQVIYRQKKK